MSFNSSGAKPQTEGRNRRCCNGNRGNTQRYESGNRGNAQRHDRVNEKGPAALAAQMKEAAQIKEILHTHAANEGRLDHIGL